MNDNKLMHDIKEFYQSFVTESDPLLRKWKKVCLMGALGAFNMGWLDFCRHRLEDLHIHADNISQESPYKELLDKQAKSVSDSTLKKAIEELPN